MKKLIYIAVFGSILALSTSFANQAEAHWRGCCYRGGWVAPALIGGVIGYELAQPRYYAPPPVVYTAPPSVVYVQPQAVPQTPPPGYHWQQIIDPQTGTEKMALVPN
jgi:hypothetical protein